MAARPKTTKQAPAEAPTLREPLTMFCYADLTGSIRGKGFPTRMLAKKLKSGVGWTPTNIMFTALGTIAPSPWGPHGDLSLMPDPATKVEVDFGDGSAAERFFLCDVRNTDGSTWDCCPRTFLKDAVAALEKETGLHLMATFEQEFVYSGATASGTVVSSARSPVVVIASQSLIDRNWSISSRPFSTGLSVRS